MLANSILFPVQDVEMVKLNGDWFFKVVEVLLHGE